MQFMDNSVAPRDGYFRRNFKRIAGVGTVSFLVGAATMMQLREFAVGCVFWLLAVIACAAILWPRPYKKGLAIAVTVLGVLAFVVLSSWTIAYKGAEPWTNFSKLFRKEQHAQNAVDSGKGEISNKESATKTSTSQQSSEAMNPEGLSPGTPPLRAKEKAKQESTQGTVKSAPQEGLPSTPRPYDLTPERRAEFLKLLTPPIGADTLRVGCASWSERACVAAGRFLVLFSVAGWKIDENRVFRMDPLVPNEGVFIVSLPEPGPPLPPHLGRWHAMNLSEITLHLAFVQMGFATDGSTDASLTKGKTGVYFGPEQAALKVDRQRVLSFAIAKFVYEGKVIKERAGNVAKDESPEEIEWSGRSEDWLRDNVNKAAAIEFRHSHGIEAKQKCFNKFAERLIQPKQP
jgi:hypothetical protein